MTEHPSDRGALSMESVREELSAVRRFAALSGPFDPVEALHSLGADPAALGADKLTLISSGLADLCDRTDVGDRQRWLMRGSERRRELESLRQGDDPAGAVAAAVARRLESDTDRATDDLLDAIRGTGRFSGERLRGLLEDGADKQELERVAEALERAGPLAPEHGLLPQVRASLTRAGLRANLRSVADRDFFGREQELARARAWVQERGARRMQALYVQGQPGIGKSTLLDETAASMLEESSGWVVVRLDFDRAGLDVQDFAGLTVELTRQVAAQLDQPVELLRAREQVAGAPALDTSIKGGARQFVPPELGRALADALGREGRKLLVLLDTMEVLRGRGETQPLRLFEWLDQLVAFGTVEMPVEMSVIAAGRGEALGSAPERVAGEPVELEGLDDKSADRLLARLGVEPEHFDRLRALTRSNPLALRLAAKIAVEHGAEAFTKPAGKDGYTAAYLYRFLLSRVGEDLQKLANPGLVVRVIDPDVIREVLAPAVRMRGVTPQRAQALFEELAGHHWLVEPDPLALGFVRHRADMRALLLPLLYDDQPARSAAIDRRAAQWFARRPEPWAAIEAAYHRLQLMRRDDNVPALDPGVLGQLDDLTIRELPAAAQDIVLRNRGERTTTFRGGSPEGSGSRGAPLDAYAVQELRAIIDKGDWVEGAYFYERAFREAVFDARSPEADTARTFLWRSGQWAEARRLLRIRDEMGADDEDLLRMAEHSPQDLACRLEMRAELSFDDLVGWLQQDEARLGLASYVVSQGLRSALGSGALRLALAAAGQHHVASPSELDPVGVAARWWQEAVTTDPATSRGDDPSPEESAGRSRIASRVGQDQADLVDLPGRVRALATLSPYADLVSTMVSTGNRSEALAFVDRAHRSIDELGLLAPAGGPPWHDQALSASESSSLHSLVDVGLLAEAVGAAAYVLRDPDLSLVAQSAERWRRTLAGTWSYGRSRPRGWGRPLDLSITDRVDQLLDADDVEGACERQLDAWCDPELAGGPALDLVRKRAPGVVTRAAAAKSTHEAARLLLGRFVPSAFVPALSVLIRQDATPHHRNPRKSPTNRKDPR